MKVLHKSCLIIFLLILTHSGANAQDFESDPEVKDIRAWVRGVQWTMDTHEYTNSESTVNSTYISFNITVELWNPYNAELVSYGSSSCRWFSSMLINLTQPHEFEIYEICTADYGPRSYSSGLYNETSTPDMEFYNQTLDHIPDGTYLISGGGNSYFNSSDGFYGVNMTIIDGVPLFDFEGVPLNWGTILFTKTRQFSLYFGLLPILVMMSILGYNRKIRNS